MNVRNLCSISCALALASCSGGHPTNLDFRATALAPCPSSPNCVSSTATDAQHAVAPFVLAAPSTDAWRAVAGAVAALPRTRIVMNTTNYLHAECRSALLGFVDDLELHLGVEGKTIGVRSASRLGYSDMGVNRKRVSDLRLALEQRGIIAKETDSAETR